jgi:hypothetical protein
VASHKDLLARVALRVGSKDKEAPAGEPQPPGFSRSSPEDRQARAGACGVFALSTLFRPSML